MTINNLWSNVPQTHMLLTRLRGVWIHIRTMYFLCCSMISVHILISISLPRRLYFYLFCSKNRDSCSPDWPQTYYKAEGHLHLLIFFPTFECWGDKHIPSCPRLWNPETELSSLSLPENHSTKWATASVYLPVLLKYFSYYTF